MGLEGVGMQPDIVFQDDFPDDDWGPAGPEEEVSGPEVSPGTVALIVAALLGAGPTVREHRMDLWKKVGLAGLMTDRGNRL